MEDNVWIDPKIKNILENEVVLVSLYVDDKKPLPDSLVYISDFSGKKITTVGQKWSDFQASRFNTNSQPYYVLMDPFTEEILIEPQGYTPDVNEYYNFLKEGIQRFKKKSGN